jgi:hypothetical protein
MLEHLQCHARTLVATPNALQIVRTGGCWPVVNKKTNFGLIHNIKPQSMHRLIPAQGFTYMIYCV